MPPGFAKVAGYGEFNGTSIRLAMPQSQLEYSQDLCY
jgi:hypothetical protein